jgi:N-acylneuraminate cytidylyltransferase/CMP-N,N'-diacetyllegionaminic acid synthase
MDTLILIPARSGSTRVKGKNIKKLGGKPLLGHVASAAVASRVGRVVVSTNSKQISELAKDHGAEAPFLRPAELSGAEAPSIWAILHALEWFRDNENWVPDILAFCPPTNPFIQPATIRSMCEILVGRDDANSIVTIAKPETHPFTIVRLLEGDRLENAIIAIDGKTINDVERSQDFPIVWAGSPACRITRSTFFFGLLKKVKELTGVTYNKTYDVNNCLGYKIPKFEALDIDDYDDWLLAEQVIKCCL